MFQNNWVVQQLSDSHQKSLREKADHARQAQDARQNPKVRKHRRMIAKLRVEMTNL